MNLFKFLKLKNKKERKLILELGSSRVRLFQALIGEDGAKIEKKFISENITLPEADFRTLWRKMLALARKELGAYKKNRDMADGALAVFGSPWYFSKTRFIEKKFAEPTPITKELLSEELRKEEKIFKKEVSQEFILSQNDLDFARMSVMGAWLNGYPVKDPARNILEKTIKEFQISVHVSVLFGEVLEGLRKLFDDCSIKQVEFQSVPWTVFKVMVSGGLNNFSFLDIGGEITDFSAVKNGEIAQTLSFNKGSNYVIRRVASATRLGLEEASDILENYKNGKVTAEVSKQLEPVLEEAGKEWHNNFMDVLEKNFGDVLLPEKMIVTGQNNFFNVEKILKSENLRRFAERGKGFYTSREDLTKIYLDYISNA